MISRMAGLNERLVSPKFTRRQANSEVVSEAAAWVQSDLLHSSSHETGWLSFIDKVIERTNRLLIAECR